MFGRAIEPCFPEALDESPAVTRPAHGASTCCGGTGPFRTADPAPAAWHAKVRERLVKSLKVGRPSRMLGAAEALPYELALGERERVSRTRNCPDPLRAMPGVLAARRNHSERSAGGRDGDRLTPSGPRTPLQAPPVTRSAPRTQTRSAAKGLSGPRDRPTSRDSLRVGLAWRRTRPGLLGVRRRPRVGRSSNGRRAELARCSEIEHEADAREDRQVDGEARVRREQVRDEQV